MIFGGGQPRYLPLPLAGRLELKQDSAPAVHTVPFLSIKRPEPITTVQRGGGAVVAEIAQLSSAAASRMLRLADTLSL